MLTRVAPLVALAATAITVNGQAFTDPGINTPSGVTQCEYTQLTFFSTAPPVIISVIPGGQFNAPALETVGTFTGTSALWLANLAAGTSISFKIRDSQGRLAYTQAVIILGSSNTSCLALQPSSSSSSVQTSATSTISPPLLVTNTSISTASGTAEPCP